MAKSPFYKVILEAADIDITDKIKKFRFENCVDEDNMLRVDMPNVTNEFIDEISAQKGDTIKFQYGFLAGEKSSNKKAGIKTIETKYGKTKSLTLKCYDVGHFLKDQKSNKVYDKITASDIVKEIAKEFNADTNIEPTSELITIPQGNKTYFEFLKRLAKKEGVDFFVTNYTINFKKRDLSKPATKNYIYNNREGNVIGFDTKYDDKGDSNKVSTSGIDSDSGDLFSTETTPTDSKETGLGDEFIKFDINGIRLNTPSESGSFKVIPETKKTEVKKQNDKTNDDALLSNLTGTLKLELDTSVDIEDIITISGVAKEHSGNWYTHKITDTISKGGAFTSVETKRNATNNPDSGDGVPKKKNKTEGDVDAQATVTPKIFKYDDDGNLIN